MNALFLTLVLGAQTPEVKTVTLKIGEDERKALVVMPRVASTNPPLVFGFHGHGGNGNNALRSFQVHQSWPEAVVIYPFGLPTKTGNDPQGLKPGWQIGAGQNGDRDLKFFDSLLAYAKEEASVDPRRIYVMGHSNGGRFTYLLWAERHSQLAAVAPCASPATSLESRLKPLPFMHIGAPNDSVVDFGNQFDSFKRTLAICLGTPTETVELKNGLNTFKGSGTMEVLFWQHNGNHKFPSQAVPVMVEFFKRHKRV